MEERIWSIVITLLGLVLKLHAETSSSYVYWRKRPNRLTHLELSHKNPDTLEMVLIRIPLSNSTVEKCAPMQVVKKKRMRESFRNQITQMSFLSGELWLIANNSKRFAYGRKLKIRSNLGLLKHSEIHLI